MDNTKIHVSDTPYEFLHFPETIKELIEKMPWTPYANHITYGATEIQFGQHLLFFPQYIEEHKREYVLNKIISICNEKTNWIFFKRNRKKLFSFMQTMYLYSGLDHGCEVAINIYKNMGEKERQKPNGMLLKNYMSLRGYGLILFYLKAGDEKTLRELLDFQIADSESLRKILNDNCNNISLEIKSYIIQAINISEQSECKTKYKVSDTYQI